MQPNREIVQKAHLALADLAPGGVLVTKQSNRFIKIALKQNVLSSKVRSPIMTNPQEELPKLLWTNRVLYPGTSGAALPDAWHSKPTFSKVTLTSKQFKGVVPVDREVFEDQIERQGFQATLTRFMAERVAFDLEDILINGDTASADATLAVQDGVLKLITSNVLNAGGVALSKDVLDDLMQTLPEEFDAQNLLFLTNRKARSAYLRSLGNRATALGDAAVTGAASAQLGYDGVPVVKVPLFPNNLGAGSTKTNVLYADPKNIVYGFQRKVTIDQEFRAVEQVFYIVVTLRNAINLEHEPACAKATEVVGQ